MNPFHRPLNFGNTQNKCVDAVIDGEIKKIWISRSLAVVGIIIVNKKYLMVKRGPGCPDEIGKWVLPCGYLDHDETLKEAILREVYEETGINLVEVRNCGYVVPYNLQLDVKDSFYGDGQPVHVRSNPRMDKKQNVSAYMFMEIRDEKMPIVEWNPSACDPNETADVAWYTHKELEMLHNAGEIGFNHFEAIKTIGLH